MKRHQSIEQEPPLDPAALAGERLNRQLAPWKVLAFEVDLAFRATARSFGEAASKLVAG